MATAKKNVRAARLKRADRKNISVGQAHIRSTFNNTIVSITDHAGRCPDGCRGCCQAGHGARYEEGFRLRQGPRLRS